MFSSFARQVKGKAQNPIHSSPRNDSFLNDHLIVRTFVNAPADVRILAFIVFAHNHEINVSGLPALEWSFDPFKEPYWPKIHVLTKSAANGDEQTPQGNVVGNIRTPDSAEKDGVERAQLLETVGRHHSPSPEVLFAAPVELVPMEVESEAAPGSIQGANAFRHYFLPDSISCNDGNAKCFHE